MKKNNNKGFTLAELLIVVAIIAVLTAIAIPVFTSQLEKSKEATDLANIRSAYAEVVATSLSDPDKDHSATVAKKQTVAGWQGAGDIAGVKIAGGGSTEIKSTDSSEVKYDHTTMKITIDGVVTTGGYTVS